jgi:protein-L-isoaspartate O-methyltransferase
VTGDDRELLEFYVARGHAAHAAPFDAAWLDGELRAFVRARLPARRPLAVCNIGIGDGTWDDWLGHTIGATITSVDRDARACRMLALRQLREAHPHPARVMCGDVRDGILGRATFDVITAIGEHHDQGATRRALLDALVPGGLLLGAEVGDGATDDHVVARGDVWLACQARTR